MSDIQGKKPRAASGSPLTSMLAPGGRRLSPAAYAARERLADYAGLPADVERHTQLLATFKNAAGPLGISGNLVRLLEQLFLFSREQDWQGSNQPIVWPSNVRLAEQLCMSRRQVISNLKALQDLNLIVAYDSPTRKRFGRRDDKGRIIEAFGFDLSLLAVRYPEFHHAVEQARLERAAKCRCRREITVARRAIREVAQSGQEHDVPGYDWQALVGQAEGDKPSLIDDLSVLEKLAADLTSLWKKAEKHFNDTVETSPQREADFTLNRNTTDKKIDSGTSSLADLSSQARPPETTRPTTITIRQIIAAAPKLENHLDHRRARSEHKWPEIVDAARCLLHPLGINQSLWGEACHMMTREGAAVAIAIISAKYDLGEVDVPGGYLRGIIDKAKIGQANLERSIWGLIKRT